MSEVEADDLFYGRQIAELAQKAANAESENLQLWALSNDIRSHVEGLAEAWTARPLTSSSSEAHRTRYQNGETLKEMLASMDALAESRKITFSASPATSAASGERPRQIAWSDIGHFLKKKLQIAVRAALAVARK